MIFQGSRTHGYDPHKLGTLAVAIRRPCRRQGRRHDKRRGCDRGLSWPCVWRLGRQRGKGVKPDANASCFMAHYHGGVSPWMSMPCGSCRKVRKSKEKTQVLVLISTHFDSFSPSQPTKTKPKQQAQNQPNPLHRAGRVFPDRSQVNPTLNSLQLAPTHPATGPGRRGGISGFPLC